MPCPGWIQSLWQISIPSRVHGTFDQRTERAESNMAAPIVCTCLTQHVEHLEAMMETRIPKTKKKKKGRSWYCCLLVCAERSCGSICCRAPFPSSFFSLSPGGPAICLVPFWCPSVPLLCRGGKEKHNSVQTRQLCSRHAARSHVERCRKSLCLPRSKDIIQAQKGYEGHVRDAIPGGRSLWSWANSRSCREGRG